MDDVTEEDLKFVRSLLTRLGWHTVGAIPNSWEQQPNTYGLIEVPVDQADLADGGVLFYNGRMDPRLCHLVLEIALEIAQGQAGPPLLEWPVQAYPNGKQVRQLRIRPPASLVRGEPPSE